MAQWLRAVEPDVVDSGDEAERSGEDSALEGDGGVRCCHNSQTVGRFGESLRLPFGENGWEACAIASSVRGNSDHAPPAGNMLGWGHFRASENIQLAPVVSKW